MFTRTLIDVNQFGERHVVGLHIRFPRLVLQFAAEDLVQQGLLRLKRAIKVARFVTGSF
jgi:hypothetical protein